MKRVSEILDEYMKAAFESAFPAESGRLPPVAVIPSARAEFGDYQCNAAMPLARILRKSPAGIAEEAISHVRGTDGIDRLETAGAGFINIWLKTDWIAGQLEELTADDRLGVPQPGAGRTIVMDYGSPNITKPLHIGHLRSHNIGSVIDRMYRLLGYRVIADNHLGDWGTQFGITIMGYREYGDETAMSEKPLEELERLYVRSYERAKTDPEWLARCRNELVKLQSGDPGVRRIWERFVRWSLKELDRIYERLGVSYDMARGESHYNDMLKGVVDLLVGKGLARESEGALAVFLDEEKLPLCIVRKSDGGYNYATTDLATLMSRVKEFDPERIVYVTDERQQLHFRQIFAISRRLGYDIRLDHVWFGLMRLPEGTFSTREGTVIPLDRLLDEAESRALAIVDKTSSGLDDDTRRQIARAVGVGAVKYADLSQNPQSLVTFTWDKALALDGNSGPYLQYAYARIAGVRGKYGERFPGIDPMSFPLSLGEPVERSIALKLLRFPDIVLRAAEGYRPNVLADYLYDLTQTYNMFYQNVPFLRAEEGLRESRVKLCSAVASVLGRGLSLLGIETPERI